MSIGSAFSQVLNMYSASSNNTDNVNRDFPFMNTVILDNRSQVQSSHLMANRKKKLMTWYEYNSSILCGQINKIVKDINEDVYFEPITKGATGRNKIKKAVDFYETNRMKRAFNSMLVDLLVTGECYGFKNNLDYKNLIKQVDVSLENKGLPVTDITRKLFLKVNQTEFDINTLKQFTNIASSTIENVHDAYNIIKYIQRVGGIEKPFSPEEIIHIKFLDVNGRPEGFSPVSTIVLQLELDYFMWKNMWAIAKNSGQPDRIYSVEDMDINSSSFKRMQRELQKYHRMRERHGSLLLNGKVTVQDLQQLDSMQFENMGIYIAGLIALQFGIPRSRLPMLSKDANTKEDTGGNAEKDYYDNIAYHQTLFANDLNQGLWIPHFGVKMKFNQSYKQDEIRENQNKQLRLNNLTLINNELKSIGKKVTSDYFIRYVNGISEEIEEDDLEDYEPETMQVSTTMNDQPSNEEMQDSPAKSKLRERRSEEQMNRQQSQGKPTGFGKSIDKLFLNKEIDLFQDEELNLKELRKDLELKEIQRVPFLTFLNLYNEDKAFNKEPPRVFMSQNEDLVRMTYRSTDFVYETVVQANQLSPTIMMNFRKIYKVRESNLLNELDNPASEPTDSEDIIEPATQPMNMTEQLNINRDKRIVKNVFEDDM